MKTKHAEVIAENLVNIFCHFGAPLLLHSDNGREFVNQVIHALLKLWPDCRMINGKARHSQSQGSVERCNRDIENMLACWQVDNNTTNWAYGLQFVQYAKNARHHTGIGRSPFMAQLGYEAQLGVQTLNLDKDILEDVTSEEDLNTVLPDADTAEDTGNSNDDHSPDVPSEEVHNDDLNKSFNNNELLDDAEFIIENDVFAETDREYEMAMSSHDKVVEDEIIPIEVAILGTAPSTNVKISACVSCDKNFGPATMSQAKSCISCQKFCHPSCMEDDKLCLLCQKQEQIFTQRQGANKKNSKTRQIKCLKDLLKGLKKPKLETQFQCQFLIWIEGDVNIQI